MKKRNIVALIAVLVVIAAFLHIDNPVSQKVNAMLANAGISLPVVSKNTLIHPFGIGLPIEEKAWNAWQKYLVYAKEHDLEGLKSLSHQISDICKDSTKTVECNELMDSVYTFGSYMGREVFTNIVSDDKQIILYTEGPNRAFLYFTRADRAIKVLGLRFCLDEESIGFKCTDASASKLDTDNDGWWDSVESLFYPS